MKPLTLPSRADALPGRATPMSVPETHFVNRNRIVAPFPDGLARAMVGMGCFWGAEKKFWSLEGVYSTAVGYAAGITPNPTYREVCTGMTGHNEVVLVVFDPKRVSYDALLKVFWENHDPTQGMRQGNDAGTQYRSVVFYNGDEQRSTAEQVIRELDAARIWDAPIVTEVRPASTFYRAEEYHQNYFRDNSHQPYCTFVVEPKVRKFREKFAHKLSHSA